MKKKRDASYSEDQDLLKHRARFFGFVGYSVGRVENRRD